MHAATHLENANFLRELAENLAQTNPQASTPERIELLQRLADAELAEAEQVEWARAKVAAARADTRPGVSNAEAKAFIRARYERLRDGV